MKQNPWYCNVKRQAEVIDRVARSVSNDKKVEAICNATVKIWDKFDTYCLRKDVPCQ